MNWLIIVAVVLILFILFKFKEVQHKIQLTALIAFLLFAALSIGHVYSSNAVDLTTFQGLLSLSKFYLVWVKQAVGNVLDFTGYITKQDWMFNITNSTG